VHGLPLALIGEGIQFGVLQPLKQRLERGGGDAVEDGLAAVENGNGFTAASGDGAQRVALEGGEGGGGGGARFLSQADLFVLTVKNTLYYHCRCGDVSLVARSRLSAFSLKFRGAWFERIFAVYNPNV